MPDRRAGSARMLPGVARPAWRKPTADVQPIAVGGLCGPFWPSNQDKQAPGPLRRQIAWPFIGQTPNGAAQRMPAQVPARRRPPIKKLSFDPRQDFKPVSLAGRSPLLLVPAAHPAHIVAELVAYSLREGKGATCASPGVGTSSHLLGEMLRSASKGNFVHVPYKGGPPRCRTCRAGRSTWYSRPR